MKNSVEVRRIFRIILFLLFLEIICRIGGIIVLEGYEQRNRLDMHNKQLYRILCIGESVTLSTVTPSYPELLEQVLNRLTRTQKVKVINKGIAGASTETVFKSLDKMLNKYEPDLVVLMLGVNDAKMIVSREQLFVVRWERCLNKLKTYRLFKQLIKQALFRMQHTKEENIIVDQNDAVIRQPPRPTSLEEQALFLSAVREPQAVTLNNFRKIAGKIFGYGSRLVIMQYPLVDIELLQEHLKEYPQIIFVENKDNFTEALRFASMEEYFIDLFAAEFGHCTVAGNELIAEELAKAIKNNCF
ncbi:MAG: hypothetical protein GY853_11255 [PVC group bacterium]|nr:hypothetical protein [PVC group bacterium]